MQRSTAVDPDIYLYGEGWTFGSAQDKGLTNCPHWCFADKYNMGGAGIGLFNDIIRDAAHGGYSQDSLQSANRALSTASATTGTATNTPTASRAICTRHEHAALWPARQRRRLERRGRPLRRRSAGVGPYVSKHDNETLFDQNVFKLPSGVTAWPSGCGRKIWA
jgi:hypothetical protein